MPVEVSFPVRYAETDSQRVVHYANYVAWFELGYEALFAALGQPLRYDRPQVSEAVCHYQAPIYYGDTVTVRSAPVQQEDDHLRIAHTICVDEEVRARGTTLLAKEGVPYSPAQEGEPLERFDGWEEVQPRGRLEEIPLRVRYAETDPTRGAHFSRYFEWLEVGRITFLRQLGLNYARMELTGSPFVIAWAGCRYLSPVYFDDPLQMRVWVLEVRHRAFSLGYHLVHAEGNRSVARAKSVQTFIDAIGRPALIPETVRERLLLAVGAAP